MRGRFRHVLALTMAGAIAWLALSSGVSVAHAETPVRFDIPALPLADSLRAVGSRVNINVLFDPQLVAGRNAPALRAQMTAEEALDYLLSGTGMGHEFLNESTVLIEVPGAKRAGTAPGATKTSAESAQRDATTLRLARATENAGSSETAENPAPSSDHSGNKGQVDEIVVTAQKRQERLQDVPISMSVLSGEHLDSSAAGGALEELNKVPAVAAIMERDGRAAVTVRGVSPQTGSSLVGYYVDSAPFTFLFLNSSPDVGIYDLERIEVLRGPQGTGYGIGSSSGVVRILTNDPDLSNFEAKGRVAVSSTDGGGTNYRTDAAVNAPIVEGRLAIRGVVGFENWGGWIDKPYKQDANEGDTTNVRLKIGGQLADDLSAIAGIAHSKRRSRAPSADNNAFRNVAYDEPTDTTTDLYSLVLKKDFGAFSLSSATSYVDLDVTIFRRSAFSLINLNSVFQHTRALAEEVNLTSNGTGPWKWTAGVFYRTADEHYTVKQGAPLATIYTAPLVINDFFGADSYAAFGELSYSFSQFELLGGLRYSKEERDYRSGLSGVNPADGTFNKVTPRLVLNWKPNQDVTTYLSYSEGFRSGILQSQAATAIGFGPAKSDLLHNYELGNKATVLDGLLSWEGAVYYMKWDDVQQGLTFPFNSSFVGASVNAGSASGFGGELSVTVRPAEGFQIGGSYSRNDLGFDTDVISGGLVLYRKGDRLAFSPKTTYSAFADYTAPVGSDLEFRIGANLSHVSSQFARFLLGPVTTIPNGPITTAGLDVGVGRRDGSSRVSLFVENLTNEDAALSNNYAAASPPAGNIDEGVRLRPRTVGVQVEMKF